MDAEVPEATEADAEGIAVDAEEAVTAEEEEEADEAAAKVANPEKATGLAMAAEITTSPGEHSATAVKRRNPTAPVAAKADAAAVEADSAVVAAATEGACEAVVVATAVAEEAAAPCEEAEAAVAEDPPRIEFRSDIKRKLYCHLKFSVLSRFIYIIVHQSHITTTDSTDIIVIKKKKSIAPF